MTAINLLPRHHLHRLAHARVLRRWTAGIMAGVVVVGSACFTLSQVGTSDDQSLRNELQKIEAQLAQGESEHTKTLAALHQIEADTQLRDAVNLPPDYARLLGVVAQGFGEDAILTSLKWDATAPPPIAAPSRVVAAPAAKPTETTVVPRPTVLQLELAGLARTRPVLAAVVQRLENSGLFDEVRLLKSNREGLLTGDATAFQVVCVMGMRPAERTAP